MKILVIHEVSYLKKVIFEMHEFPELLAAAGNEVHFLEFPEGTGFRFSRLKGNSRWVNGRVHPDARVKLITPFTLGGGLIDRIFAPITALPSLWRLLSNGGYDVVLLYSVPTTGWQTVRIAKYFRIPVVFRALDVSHLIRKGMTSRLIRLAEKYVYKNATVISANNHELGSYIKTLGSRNDEVRINLPPIDIAHFAKPVSEHVRPFLSLSEGSFVIAYMGSLFEFSGLNHVIDSLYQSGEDNDYLLIIGGGKAELELKKKVAALGLSEKVIFTGFVAYEDLPEYLSAADVLVNPFEQIKVTDLALPHKVVQYLSTGIPTVSTKLKGLLSVLDDNSGVFWADDPKQVFDIAKSLKSISPGIKNDRATAGLDFIYLNFDQDISRVSLEGTLRLAITLSQQNE